MITTAYPTGILLYTGNKKGSFNKPILWLKQYFFAVRGWEICPRNTGVGDFNGDGLPDFLAVQHFGESPYNFLVFKNGYNPATLKISNLNYSLQNQIGNNITIKGSVNFFGDDIDLRYVKDKEVTNNAFLKFYLSVSFPGYGGRGVDVVMTGTNLHKPGFNAGTIDFEVSLIVSGPFGMTPTIKIKDFYLTDYNLVESNHLGQ
jgi:hypothetical protein